MSPSPEDKKKKNLAAESFFKIKIMKKNKVIELVIQWFIVVSGSSYRGKTSEKMFLRSVREERRKENMYYPEYLQKYRHLMKNTKSLRAPSHRVLRVKALLCFFLSLCAHFCRHITHFLTFQDSMAHLLFFFVFNLKLMTSVKKV